MLRSTAHPADPERRVGRGPAPARNFPQRAPHSSTTLTELQRTVGNRAASLVVQRDKTKTKAKVKVKTKATTPMVTQGAGLGTGASHQRYVAHAITQYTTNKAMLLTTFADDLTKAIGGELSRYGVPPATMVPDASLGGLGEFDQSAWVLKINVARFGSPAAKKLGDLSIDQVKEAAGTIYHEARHADQDVLVVRSLLHQKWSVDKIAAATRIRKDIVETVRNTKYGDVLDAATLGRAGRMFDVMYGQHNELLTFYVKHGRVVAGIDALGETGSTLAAAATHVRVFVDWHAKVLTPKIAALGRKSTRTPAEATLLTDLKQIDTSAKSFIKEWNATFGNPSAHPDDVELVREDAAKLAASLDKAYRNLESEKDAFRVETDVNAVFDTSTGAPARKP